MAKITPICPTCSKKNVHETKHRDIGSRRLITLDCSHQYMTEKVIEKEIDSTITLKDGKELYKYQVEGYQFAAKSNFNCLIADQTGLGKTIQAVAIMNLHWKEMKPFLVICKGSLTLQWQRHILLGCEKMSQIIEAKTKIQPGLGCYIVSFDMTYKLAKKIRALEIKTVIADEIQMIKNNTAKRTNGVRKIIKGES